MFHDPVALRYNDSLRTEQSTRELAWLLALDARRLESEGQLDEALDRYLAMMHMARHVANRGTILQRLIGTAIEGLVFDRMPLWAAHSEQTPERIRKAIAELQRLGPQFPSATDTMKVEYLVLRRLMDSDPEDIAPIAKDVYDPTVLVLWGRLMPWEMTRSRRLLDALANTDIQLLAMIERELATGQWKLFAEESLISRMGAGHYDSYQKAILTSPFVRLVYPANDFLIRAPGRRLTQLRALQIILALKGWQDEHDELPRSLNDLEGSYFDKVPPDPFTGQPFGYQPDGFPDPVRFAEPADFESKPDQPLLWSAGFGHKKTFGRDESGWLVIVDQRMMGQNRGTKGSAQAGWAFPIP